MTFAGPSHWLLTSRYVKKWQQNNIKTSKIKTSSHFNERCFNQSCKLVHVLKHKPEPENSLKPKQCRRPVATGGGALSPLTAACASILVYSK